MSKHYTCIVCGVENEPSGLCNNCWDNAPRDTLAMIIINQTTALRKIKIEFVHACDYAEIVQKTERERPQKEKSE